MYDAQCVMELAVILHLLENTFDRERIYANSTLTLTLTVTLTLSLTVNLNPKAQ